MISVAYDGILVSVLIIEDNYLLVDSNLNILAKQCFEPFPISADEMQDLFGDTLEATFGKYANMKKCIEQDKSQFAQSDFIKELRGEYEEEYEDNPLEDVQDIFDKEMEELQKLRKRPNADDYKIHCYMVELNTLREKIFGY